MTPVSIYIAFLAGIVSFLAPCVLPIIPGFLAYLAGAGVGTGEPKRKEMFLNSLFFVFGFSIVFAILGILLNTILQAAAYSLQTWLARIGGILIIFFGLYLAGLIKIGFLSRDHKILVKTKFSSRYLTSLVFGAAFAAGWTPCVGAALGAILALAAAEPGRAFFLLLAYSIGLGIPFLLVGLFAAQATSLINRYAKWFGYINIVFGIILIALGILVFTQNLSMIANWSLLNKILLR